MKTSTLASSRVRKWPFVLVLMVIAGLLTLPSASAQSWQWAVRGGSNDYDEAQKVAIDGLGNIYVTGYFHGTATFGSTTLTSAGYGDIFVAKLNANGVYQWALRAGGLGDDRSLDIAVGSNGNIAITGHFRSQNADFGAITVTNADWRGYPDVFVAQLNAAGIWQWAKSTGSTVDDFSNSVAIDGIGNVIIAGDFNAGTSIIFGADTLISNASHGYRDNIFVAKLNSFGTWQWAKQAGGTNGAGTINAVAVDASGNIAVTGSFYGSDATFGTTTLPNADAQYYTNEAFVARISSAGAWQWAKRIGDANYDYGKGIAIDGSGNIVVTGEFQGQAIFGATALTSVGFGTDIYVARLSPGGAWQWAEKVGGLHGNSKDIAVDASGNVAITGNGIGASTFGNTNLITSGDNFVARLNSAGIWQQVARIGSGVSTGRGYGVASDAAGNTIVAGGFGGIILGSTNLSGNGGLDAFIARLSWAPVPPQLNAYHLQTPGNLNQRVRLDRQAAGAIRVAADYSASTLFKFARPNTQQVTVNVRENVTNTGNNAIADVTGYISSVTVYPDSVIAVYQHPARVDSSAALRVLHVDILNTTNPTASIILDSYRLEVVRPPLLLVHGIWSNGVAAFPGLKDKLLADHVYNSESQIRYADYANDRALAVTVRTFINHKNAILKTYADANISAAKVDVISHSMGGLIARQYIQDNIAYKNDINKLITLNTPHSGSPMANFLAFLPPPATAALALAGHDPNAGAAADLRYNGPAITSLNTNPDTKGVAIHAITTDISISTATPLQALLNGQFSYGGFLAGWMALTYPAASSNINSFLTNDIFRSTHDLVVGVNSQLGGLGAGSQWTTQIHGQWHGSGGNPAVQTKMEALLRENSNLYNLNQFTRGGFHPPILTSIIPRPAVSTTPVVVNNPSQTTGRGSNTSTVNILAPIRNTVSVDADSLYVTVSGSSDVTNIILLCGANTAEVTTRLIPGAAGSAYIRVPQGSLGRLHLTAFAFAGTTYVEFDTLSVAVTTASTLSALRIEPGFIYTSRNDSTLVRIMGTYTNGVERNMTGFSGLTYSFPGSRARGRAGWVIGLAVGLDSLRVTYAGKRAAALVEVVAGTPTATPLPVKLISFTAEFRGHDTSLRWATASEENNAYFAVESSGDGQAFTEINRQNGKGNHNSPTIYTAIDTNVKRYATEQVYYRLRQVDRDGLTAYSPMRVVQIPASSGLQMQVYPNPYHQELMLFVRTAQAGPANVQLTDALGRVIWQQQIELPGGTVATTVSLTKVAPQLAGIYMLRVQQNTQQQTLRIVQQ